MMFEFSRCPGAESAVTHTPTFHVRELASRPRQGGGAVDLSHMIDRSYAYHSARELRWHLAERFGTTPAAVTLQEAR